MVLLIFWTTFLLIPYFAQATPDAETNNPNPAFTYIPLENKPKDLAALRSYWPMKEDSFIPDLQSIDAVRWAIILCSAKSEPGSTGNTTMNRGILDNNDALEEMESLKHYIDQQHVVKSNDNYEYRYVNVCLSYLSPITNRSVCQFPEIDLVQILKSSVHEKIWKKLEKPSLYPQYGDKAAPLGLKSITGPIFGDVDIDKTTGEVRSIKWIALKYFLRTFPTSDGIEQISSMWRNSLRDYILNKFVSNIIDVKYMDDELMRLPINEKESNANLVRRLLDPTPTDISSSFWSNGLTAQLLFDSPIDLSKEPEVKRVLKVLASFENSPYTFGQEGTVCWIRAFIEWRKWLVSNLYGQNGSDSDDQSENNENKSNSKEKPTLLSNRSPFGNFKDDLRIFLQNPNYPVYSKHVVLNDPFAEGQPDIKAFRCLITLKNLTSQTHRQDAVRFLRDTAGRFPGYNISVIAMDFFPVTSMANSIELGQNLILVFAFSFVGILIGWK